MIPIATGYATSTAANTTTAQTITKSYEFLGPGRLVLIARGSATGMAFNLFVGGVQLGRNTILPFVGAAGGLDAVSHVVIDQRISGGRVEMDLVNTTAGALTTDYQLLYEPSK